MKIRNVREYVAALEKAAILLEHGFEGSIEREKYFREIVNAVMDYEKEHGELTLPPKESPKN